LHKKDVNRMRTIDFSPLYRSVVGFDRLADLLENAAADCPEELNVEVKENLLTVQGRKTANDEGRQYLHRGLAERNFERRFQLADYVVVTDASLADGLLQISLKRELPEALKPRRIEINSGGKATLIEGEKAA
jgi:molecular chaperone IbpA